MEELIDVLNDVEEDDFNQIIYQPPKLRRIRPRVNHFHTWDEDEFFKRFRFHKETATIILHQIQDLICNKTNKNYALSPEDMLLIALRYYACGNFLINIGDHSGVHVSTVSRVVHKVSRAIASLSNRYISMPSTHREVDKVKGEFYNIAKFPNCIGAVDCTHVKISSPGGDDAELYRNRKNFFSLNVQTVCDTSLKIRDIVCRWPGSTHDARIFSNSRIRARLEGGEFGNSSIVGDSGYGQKNYLLTPLTEPRTLAEQLYQESQVRTRNPIERAYGVWKRRFPVIATGIRLKHHKLESVIVATSVLHNIACERNEDVPPISEEVQEAINFVNSVRSQPIQRSETTRPVKLNQTIQYFQSIIDSQQVN